MSAIACSAARAQLAAWIADGMRGALASELAAHLASCSACGAWSRAELALDRLLGEEQRAPRADPFLARRVLERLSAARADSAREQSSAAERGVEARGVPRDALDELLGKLPAPQAAPDLASALLRKLEPARRGARRARALRRWAFGASAAACALAVFAASRFSRAPERDEREAPRLAGVPHEAKLDDPPFELLEQLELLEDWELYVQPDALAAEAAPPAEPAAWPEAWHETELAFWWENAELSAPIESGPDASIDVHAQPSRPAAEGG
jgi:hypothetical protein